MGTMKADDALIFIDANKYLDLYRVTKTNGRRLLELLIEQQDHIFVTRLVKEEVLRNKLREAATSLARQLEQLKIIEFNVPDHLFDPSEDTAVRLCKKLNDINQGIKEVNRKIQNVNADLVKTAVQTLKRVGTSVDEVSKALNGLFSKAVNPTSEEITDARDRKERGNPPGKKTDPLGDQLTWEQLLNIIPLDKDFHHKTPTAQEQAIRVLQACATSAGLNGTVVPVWETPDGRMAFVAPGP